MRNIVAHANGTKVYVATAIANIGRILGSYKIRAKNGRKEMITAIEQKIVDLTM